MTVRKRWLAIAGSILASLGTLFAQYMDKTGMFTP